MVDDRKVPEGYKVTEVGVIPEDWDVQSLGTNSILKARIGWQGLTTAEYLTDGEYYLITGTDFVNGRIDWDNCYYVEKQRYEQDRNIQVRKKDILVTKDGTIGKVAFIDQVMGRATLNSGVFAIRPLKSTYEPEYLYHILMSRVFRDFLDRLAAGSTISHLYQKDFVHFEFPIPSITEQKAMAEALSDTDNLILSLEKLIDKKKKIKQGAMQQLLTGKKRLPGFSEQWEIKELFNIGRCIRGVSYKPDKDLELYDTDSTIRLLRSNNIFDSTVVLKDLQYVHESKVKLHQIILRNDIVICMANGSKALVGKAGIFKENSSMKYTIGAFMAIFRVETQSVSEKFVSYFFQSYQYRENLKVLLAGSSINNLKPDDIESIRIRIPKLPEQKAIAKVLSDMDAEIEALEEKLEKVKTIKQGMMQELLTGRIRLI